MANTIDAYNPIFYAQEAIALLENALGMGNRVYRGYDNERRSANKGDTIQIPKPSRLDSQAGGTGTVQDIDTEYMQITLDKWQEVKFGLTDQELAYTGEKIIQDHISEAVYQLANYVDGQLTGLYSDIPWSVDGSSSPAYADFLAARKVLRDVAGTVVDMGDNHFAIDSTLEAAYLGMSEWKDAQIVGAGNQSALMQGSIGMRAGVQPFVNQNLETHTSGTVVSAGTDVVGALTADADKGATSVAVGSLSGVETLAVGDSFVIAGNTQRYTVQSATTLAAGAATIATVFPAMVQDYSSGAVITFEDGSGATIHADSFYSNIMFNRKAFALAFAPLPEIADGAGARMAVVTDPRTGISIRSRMSYVDSSATVVVTLDVLFGVKTIDPNRAVIYRHDL